jgi:ABC-type polysaccharide/polyol phosphate transport system ATPase subunit
MPETRTAYSFTNLSKVYRLYTAPRDRLFEALTGRVRHAEVHALRNVSGSIERGAVLGVVGENGSGKSTLFKILAGTTAATSGSVSLPGRIASILELGSSFHPDDTGRRNVILQAALAGLSREEVANALPGIEEFAELGDFFDRPVKTYSSGMQMRLAFAVATAVLPDIILLDEALAVGDGRFQKKCVDRIFELKASGKTIFFCSHAMYYVSTLCDRVLWLNAGRVEADGSAQTVVLEYERFLAGRNTKTEHHAAPPAESHGRITGVTLLGADGSETDEFRPNEPWAVEISFEGDVADRLMQVHFGVGTLDNVVCFTADSRLDGAGPFGGRARHRVRVALRELPLGKGEFIVNVFLGDEKALALYDSQSRTFRVESETWRNGLMRPPLTWESIPADGDPG